MKIGVLTCEQKKKAPSETTLAHKGRLQKALVPILNNVLSSHIYFIPILIVFF
jgi:hypothetical protein